MRKIALVLVSIFLFGCAKSYPMQTVSPKKESDVVFVKNYEVGISQKAFVGEPIVKVKNYTLVKTKLNAVEPNSSFSISFGSRVFLSGDEGEQIDIVGSVYDKEKNRYDLLRSSREPQLLLPITSDGRYLGGNAMTYLDDAFVSFEGKGNISPVDTVFSPATKEEVDAKSGFVNYEIVYTGISGDSISLLYREYTPDDMARAAFFQNLSYPIDTKTIRFKTMKILVESVNEESIVYKVIEE